MEPGDRVPIPNALTINRLGLEGRPFPAWAWTHEVGDVHVVSVGAMRVTDLAPVLVESGAEFTFVFDLEPSSFRQKPDGEFVPVSALDIAAEGGIDVFASDSDSFVIRTTDLARLFEAVGQYEVSLVGIDDADRDLSSLWVAAQDVDWSTTRAILPRLKEVAFFADVHDDCFVHAEFLTRPPAHAITARMLRYAIGTALSEFDSGVPVSPPTPDEVDLVLGHERRFVTNMTGATIEDSSSISVPFMRAEWRVPGTIVPTHQLTYRFNGKWVVDELQ